MTADAHEVEVARLREAYAALPPGAPVRLAKRTSNLFRFRDGRARGTSAGKAARVDRGLDVSAFGHVLCVDPATRTARVGGMTTYEDLCDATLRHQLMPLVVPQLKTITLGGAVTGLGIESTALRSGMPHESVTEMEILTGDGRVIRATDDNEHADLFRGFPNSYGTLGYSLSLTIELEPVQPFVHIRHFPFGTRGSLHGRDQPDRRGGQLPRPPGGFRRRHRVRTRRALPHRRGVQRRGAVAQRLHRPADLLRVGQAGQGGLPHHPRLPVALGHRLVLVLAALRGTETPGQEDVAASLPALGRVPQAGRPGPPLWPLRPRERAAAPAATGEGHPGRGDPGRTWCRVPTIFPGKCGNESGMDVPAAAARRADLASLSPTARRGVRELRVLGDRAAARGPGRTATTTASSRTRSRGWTGTSRCIPRRSTPRTSSTGNTTARRTARSSAPTTARAACSACMRSASADTEVSGH